MLLLETGSRTNYVFCFSLDVVELSILYSKSFVSPYSYIHWHHLDTHSSLSSDTPALQYHHQHSTLPSPHARVHSFTTHACASGFSGTTMVWNGWLVKRVIVTFMIQWKQRTSPEPKFSEPVHFFQKTCFEPERFSWKFWSQTEIFTRIKFLWQNCTWNFTWF